MADRIEEKLDRLAENVSEIRIDLSEHMRRTAMAEADIDLLRKDFAPIKTHVAVVGALVKALGLIGTVVGIAAGLMKVLGK